MKIKVLLFGNLADSAGCSSLVEKDVSDLNELLKILKSRFTFLNSAVFAVARNQEIVRDNPQLSDGDEIALLPPFAGG
jgi:molybdopterin converting factor small subunit